MREAVQALQSAIKYEFEVREHGRVEFQVPFAQGERVVVFVIREESVEDTFDNLLSAAESSLGFWDNAYDDEDWNDA